MRRLDPIESVRKASDIFPFSSHSVADTRRAGARFANSLEPGDIVALQGDLGAGKTEFVRGACEALGVGSGQVTSPTFTIVNEYDGEHGPVYHIDVYRLETESEFYDLGYEDYFLGNAVSFVEWPERLPTVLTGDDVVRLKFEHHGGNERTISLVSPGEPRLAR